MRPELLKPDFSGALASRHLWERFGVRPEAIYEGCYTLSADDIDRVVGDPGAGMKLQDEYGLRGKFVYLFVGNFSRDRDAARLVRTYLAVGTPNTALVMIGAGEQGDEIEDVIRMNPGRNIHLVSPVSFEDLHVFYGAANAYVHPGREPYSLALQEAALLGIPIVATRAVGAAHDFVHDGIDGFLIDAGDSRQLEDALLKVRQTVVGDEAKESARARGVEFAVHQFESMIEFVRREGA